MLLLKRKSLCHRLTLSRSYLPFHCQQIFTRSEQGLDQNCRILWPREHLPVSLSVKVNPLYDDKATPICLPKRAPNFLLWNNTTIPCLQLAHISTHLSPDFNPGEPCRLDISLELKSDIKLDKKVITSSSKKKTGRSNEKDVVVPKQSSHAGRILFQSIAPHVEFRTLHQLTKQLSKNISRGHHPQLDTLDRGGKKRTLKRRLEMLFDLKNDPDNNTLPTKIFQYSWSVKSQPWMEPIIYDFLMGKYLDNPAITPTDESGVGKKALTSSISRRYQKDESYPPNQNRQKHQRNLEILLKAREVSLIHPIFWTDKSMRESDYFLTMKANKASKMVSDQYNHKSKQIHYEKGEKQLISEGEWILDLLLHRLPPPHFEKLLTLLEKFAELEDSPSIQMKKDSWIIDDDTGLNKRKKTNQGANQLREIKRTDPKQNRIQILGKLLNNVSASHCHLVAVDLGRYLYADVPLKSIDGNKVSAEPSIEEENDLTPPANVIANIKSIQPAAASFAIKKNRKLHSSEKRYQKTQDDFVAKMVQLQHEFASWDHETAPVSDTGGDDDVDDDTDTDNDVSADLNVKEFQKEQLKYSMDVRMNQQESLAETLLELQKMGLRKSETTKKSRGRPRKGTHLRFTAIKTNDTSSCTADQLPNEVEMEQRIVFINNLPIDTNEEEIERIYSRCGALDSVQLFNLRPDLDPGPLTKKQLEERRRKQRLRNKESNASTYASYQQQSMHRPRTPVYGILSFQTAEGFGLATSPEMRLFGCVIRRHPVMSIKPRDVKTLYIENIPPNLFSIEVEYQLARLLHPHNMHVMLDGMKGIGLAGQENNGTTEDYQEYSEPSSCEVKFENFHNAYEAYDLIKEAAKEGGEESLTGNSASFIGSEDCQVHWFRTPLDGMKYWTRELNF